MEIRDYEGVASALRVSLGYAERVRVYRHLVPVFASHENFNPVKFGDSLGIPRNISRIFLTDHKKEEGQNASQEEEWERCKATSEEGDSSEDQEASREEDYLFE